MLSSRYWSTSKPLGSESSTPTWVISEPELRASTSWPDNVAHSDLVACLCLGLEGIRWLRSHRNPVTRLAQGLRLAGLPYPGFVPHPVEAPHTVVRYVADQIGVSALPLDEYATAAERTRREHAATAISYLGWSVYDGALVMVTVCVVEVEDFTVMV